VAGEWAERTFLPGTGQPGTILRVQLVVMAGFFYHPQNALGHVFPEGRELAGVDVCKQEMQFILNFWSMLE